MTWQETIIVGNLGRDPELRYTPNGTAVCDFSMAVNKTWTDRETQERREKTTWFRVTAWRHLAELASQYLSKGRQVLVAGEIDASAWVGQDGEPRASLELTASTIRFLQGGEGGMSSGGAPPPAEYTDNDIPF